MGAIIGTLVGTLIGITFSVKVLLPWLIRRQTEEILRRQEVWRTETSKHAKN